jgi:EAL domain-containing protein (putative c-di-GMP-specific phosphodiesterase class I)
MLRLEHKLRRAIEAEQFVLHYQPKISSTSGRVVGVEALIRWNDPDIGLVPPADFVPMLEETGLILKAGQWALREALATHREWSQSGLQSPRIAVNVSAVQLRQADFVETVRAAIAASGVTAQALELEITETIIMDDVARNIRALQELQDAGVTIAIDDFGTGYASLRYLAKLPVDALKIDRSFIMTMASEHDSMTIVSTIVSLAHSLSLTVVAEGVETEEQAKFLRLMRCDEMQGYLFSRPLTKSACATFLRTLAPRKS